MSDDVWSEVYSEPPKPDAGFDPEPPSLASTDTEFGTVLASLDGGRNVLVRTEGGRELFVQNTLFRQVRRGDKIAAFFTSEGWSVVSPRWSAWSPVSVAHEIGRPLGDLLRAAHDLWPSMGDSEPQVLDSEQLHQLLSILDVTSSKFESRLAKARLTFGSIVSFRVDSVKEDDPMWLIGHIDALAVPAVLHRRSLRFPRSLPNYPAELLVDKSLKVFVADVDQRPIHVARHVHEHEFFARQPNKWDASIPLPTDMPEHFLHIDALSRHWEQLEATVVAVEENHCRLGILGINRIWLPQEEYSWNAEASPPRLRQRIGVKVWADRDELQLWASARILDRDCWETVKRNVSIGTVWSRAHRCRTSALGAVYETVSGNLRLQGWAPLVMSKDTLEGFQINDFDADEHEVRVVDYDDAHCRFELGHAVGVSEAYRVRVSDLIPVNVLWKEENTTTVQWSPVHPPIRVPRSEGGESTGGKALVARVETADEEGTPISLTLLPSVANWEVVKAESEFVHLRSVATGGALMISQGDTLGEFQVGDTIWLSWSKTSFGDRGPSLSGIRCVAPGRFPIGTTVTGRIREAVKGGLVVELGEILGFLPTPEIDIIPPKDLTSFVGNSYALNVIKVNEARGNVILSRREIIKVERSEKRGSFMASKKPGDIVKGVVKNITDFGAFVDLNGMDGLLHITDITWGRLNHPSEVLKVGMELDVMILEINKDKGRVSLGLKQNLKNPRDKIEERFAVGAKVKGKVTKLMPYGAFVELEEGVEGLIHISEISWTKSIARPNDVFTLGQEVEVVVLGVNKDEQKISLGVRQLETNPWDEMEHKYPIGKTVKGTVRNMTDYGAFVELEEGVTGMVHIQDISWARKINHPSEMLKKGDEVEAVVIDIDKKAQRISLGMKQMGGDPWKEIEQRFKIGDKVRGKVRKRAAFGAFVELDGGIDGLVHISQISEDRIEKVKDVLKVGQELEARVIKVDKTERRIGLSIKASNYSDEEMRKVIVAFEAWEPEWGTTSTPTDEDVIADIRDGFLNEDHKLEWISEAKVTEAVACVAEGILVPEDFAERRASWATGVSIEQALALVKVGILTVHDFTNRRRKWIASATPEEAVAIVYARILMVRDFSSRKSEWRASATPEQAAALVNSGMLAVSDLVTRKPEGISQLAMPVNDDSHLAAADFATGESERLVGPKPFSAAPPKAYPCSPKIEKLSAAIAFDTGRPLILATIEADIHRWFAGEEVARLEDALRDARLPTIASLFAFAENRRLKKPTWVSPWSRLGALLNEATGCESGMHDPVRNAERLERILTALASNPAEIALYAALFRLLPAEFLRDRWKMLHEWLLHLRPDRELDWRLGIALLRAWAAERAGEPGLAFTHLNELTTEVSDPALRRILVGWVSQQEDLLKNRSRHYGEYTRIFGDPVRTGGFAHVIPVRSGAGERYALKHIRLRPLTPDEIRSVTDLFCREASILARVRHENIVRFERELGEGAILLEWLPGRPLKGRGDVSNRGDEIDGLGDNNGWWNLPRIVDLGRRVALAMAELERGFGSFVHNDLTPRNLMIDQARGAAGDTAWVKLIDFGLACSPQFFSISTVIDEAGVRLREPYRAPEAQRGVFNNPGSDMYSLGVILFQLITRRYPRLNATPQLDWEIDAVAPESLRSAISSDFSSLILRLLARQPDARLRTWKEVVSSLDALRPSSATL